MVSKMGARRPALKVAEVNAFLINTEDDANSQSKHNKREQSHSYLHWKGYISSIS